MKSNKIYLLSVYLCVVATLSVLMKIRSFSNEDPDLSTFFSVLSYHAKLAISLTLHHTFLLTEKLYSPGL